MLRDRWLFGRKTSSFTLQWHLTSACELHCRHCYDRSNTAALDLAKAIRILDGFILFCKKRHVKGHISLTGGNPFLYQDFIKLYEEISKRGIPISIYGNPISDDFVEKIVSIQNPVYFQVSLEGLKDHNDYIRGVGHFDRTVNFLQILGQRGVRRHVMLTLSRDNMDQVIPLAESLVGSVERLTFNRLSQVGEGASLEIPTKERLVSFMKQYLVASRTNKILSFKDNLFNIFRHHYHRPLFGGCTHFGCGAAFNFIALLPDGEVHACRKFPSRIGNILENDLNSIYESKAAKQYRQGCQACKGCRVRKKCGGCLAVSYSQGSDVFKDKDPHCFMAEHEEVLANF